MSRNPKLATDGVPPGAKSFGLLSLLHHHAFLAVLALAIFITSMAWLPRAFTWTTTKIRDYRTGRLYKTAHDHFRAGRFAEAIEDYSLILAIDPDNLYHCLHARTARRDCYVELGISYKALADADYLVHEFGMLPDVVLERGEIHLKFGNYQAAAADSEAVFSRADNERDHKRKYKAKRNAAFLRARIHEAEGQYQAALDLLTQQVDFLNADEVCYTERALLRSRMGHFAGALQDFQQALQLEETDPTVTYSPPIHAKSPFAHFLATCPDEEFRDGKRAMELALRAATATKYEHPAPLVGLAAACAEMGDFPAAVKWQQTAESLSGQKPGVGPSRVELYRQSRPFRFAVERSSSSSDITPKNSP